MTGSLIDGAVHAIVELMDIEKSLSAHEGDHQPYSNGAGRPKMEQVRTLQSCPSPAVEHPQEVAP
jgi:hypothetical protein